MVESSMNDLALEDVTDGETSEIAGSDSGMQGEHLSTVALLARAAQLTCV